MAWKINEFNFKKGYELRSKLSDITNGLCLYEKISFIFLLCNDSNGGSKAMETILKDSDSKKQNSYFYKWLKEQYIFINDDWPDKVAELLSIIQNYRLAKILGFSKKELLEKYEPKNNLKSHYICNMRKVLYNLCEHFTKDDSKNLITAIKNMYNVPENYNTVEEKYLEYMLLFWNENNVISLESNENINVNALTECLSSLGHSELVNDIEIVAEKVASLSQRKKATLVIDLKVPEYYPIIDNSNVGYCVIINEKNFTNDLLTTRCGSGKDVERLVEIFTVFGFCIHIYSDLTQKQLLKTLLEYAKSIHRDHSCFVLIILSHGSENVIYTSDSVPIDMDTIEMTFQAEICPNLIGKPKIFIIQSCQGQKWQRLLSKADEVDVAIDAPESSISNHLQKYPVEGPQKGDSIIAWSTVLGFASFRDKYNGSWYIQELCKELWKLGDITDLVEIFTKVNNNLRSKVFSNQFMVPSLLLSLRAKVKLPVLDENLVKGKKLMLERLIFNKYFKEFLVTGDYVKKLSIFCKK